MKRGIRLWYFFIFIDTTAAPRFHSSAPVRKRMAHSPAISHRCLHRHGSCGARSHPRHKDSEWCYPIVTPLKLQFCCHFAFPHNISPQFFYVSPGILNRHAVKAKTSTLYTFLFIVPSLLLACSHFFRKGLKSRVIH